MYLHFRRFLSRSPMTGGQTIRRCGMSLLEAIVKAGGEKMGPELWLLFVRSEPKVRAEVVRAAEKLARNRLLALEGVRYTIGPHALELQELERVWAVLAHALEEVG
jgi:hypothetical protein